MLPTKSWSALSSFWKIMNFSIWYISLALLWSETKPGAGYPGPIWMILNKNLDHIIIYLILLDLFWPINLDLFGSIWTHFDLLGPNCPVWTHLFPFWQIWTYWSIWTYTKQFETIWTHLDKFRSNAGHLDWFGAICSHLQPIGPLWTNLDPIRTIDSYFEPFGAIWSHFGAIWSHLESFGAIWS